MNKLTAITLSIAPLFLSGCISQLPSSPVYHDPVGEGSNIARIRFVGNITGTSIAAKEDSVRRYLIPHTALGFYNDTRDIGMPKLSYRPQDYKGYYFEVRVKPQPMVISVSTDDTDQGSCAMSVLIEPEAGKDYDINFDPHEQFTKCVFHFNQIVADPATGVPILKPVPFRKVKLFENRFD